MLTYVNYAGLAPLRPQSYLRSLFSPELLGNVLLPKWMEQVQRLRQKIAAWIGCMPEQVAFVPNTSMALTIAAYSLDWKSGDITLYPAHDFPSNVQPWQKLSRFGVEALGTTHWSGPWPENTRMISLSTVDFTTGIEQPWQEVIARARAANIWTCVDAIQSAGIKPSWHPDIDFWCTGTQKWLVSGLGLAVMILSERVLGSLSPPFPNWLGLKDPPLIASGIDHTARGWEVGWITPAAFTRFEASLDYFNQIGWNTVTERVKERRDYLHEQLLEMGWHVVSCPSQWSGIVSFDPGRGLAGQIVKDGYKHRIITAKRGDYVRLSPHMFTSMRQLQKVSQWLHNCYIDCATMKTVN